MKAPLWAKQAPAWVQVIVYDVAFAITPWMILAFTSRASSSENQGFLIFAGLFVAIRIWAYIKSPSAQDQSGLVFSAVMGGIVLIEGVFALEYYIQSARNGGAFSEPLSRVDAAYFAVSTATTTGMGDIHPVTQIARILVTAQMAVTFFLVVTAVTTAVSRHFALKHRS